MACFVCRDALPNKKDRRRIQSSDCMYHELQYQLSLRAVFDKDSQSQADSATVNVPSETINCRPCMRRFEKLKKLRNELSVNE